MNRLSAAAHEHRLTPDRLLTPAGLTAIAVVVFVVISFWWVSVDTRVPDYDSGKHLLFAFYFHDLIQDGEFSRLFESWTTYPPLVHMVGASAALVTGPNIAGPVMAQNLLFCSLLAVGCYGAGTVAYDSRVGVLAVLFALATPMIISQFHVFILDAPLAAMVAVSVWLALASERFAQRGYALAFGAAVGLGLLIKSTYVLFIVGLVLVMVLRGGWRNWRTLMLSGAVGAAVAAPWYLQHLGDLGDQIGTVSGGESFVLFGVEYPARWTLADFAWYSWNLVNNQLYLPLTILFGIGFVTAAVTWLRERRSAHYEPELLAGVLGGWVGITLLSINDPRYTLPCLVYLAVLGTAWIVRSSPSVRTVGTAILLSALIVNTATVSFGVGSPARIPRTDIEDASDRQILKGQLTLTSNGYIEGGPDRDTRILDVIKAGHRDGIEIFAFRGESSQRYNSLGLRVFARMAHVRDAATIIATLETRLRLDGQPYLVILNHKEPPGYPPCGGEVSEGTGAYVLRGTLVVPPRGPLPKLPIDTTDPFSAYELFCPFDNTTQPASNVLPHPPIGLR